MNIIIEIIKCCIFALLVIGLILALQSYNLEKYYLGICAYSMPMIVLYILEDYVNKTLIGFGDIKLMMGIGGLLKYTGMENVMNFYIILYSFSGIVAFLFLFLKKWKKYEYIPFAPFIVISYVIFEIFFYKVF